jgi:hypothetical protein
VRVRDRDRAEPAELLDAGADLVVEQRDAVPEDVPARCLDEEGALPDREARRRADANQARPLLPDVRAMVAAKIVERRPPLAVPADVLSLVLADRAARRRLRALRELTSARDADEVRQLS